MSACEIDIETIVREVIRRLRDATSDAQDSITTIVGKQRAAPSLQIDDRVVTLTTLEGKLTGVQTIVLPPRTIITPAARDELRQRGIAIERAENATLCRIAKAEKTPGFTVVVAASGVCQGELRRLLGKAVNVVKQAEGDAAASIKALCAGVVAGGRGVLLTSTPAAAAMLANRVNGVRAAYGFNFSAIRRAKDEIDANLLVIEPAGKSVAELAGMIVEFERK